MTTPRPGISCYGKLPFHPEYLRFGLGSPPGMEVVRWIDGAHAALSSGRHGEPGTRVVSFALRPRDGRGIVAGVVRQSSDGQRRHPICLFTEEQPAGVEERWHLLPIALGETWAALRAVLDRRIQSTEELKEVLVTALPAVVPSDAEPEYEAWMSASASRGPWSEMTQADGEEAANLAKNLLAAADAQRDARRIEEGVAFAVSLPAGDGRRHAAAWLDLFAAAAGRGPSPTIALWDEEESTCSRLCALYRPVEGEDLAAMLGRLDTAPIDDLAGTWGVEPASAALLASVLAAGPGSLADLRKRLGAGV